MWGESVIERASGKKRAMKRAGTDLPENPGKSFTRYRFRVSESRYSRQPPGNVAVERIVWCGCLTAAARCDRIFRCWSSRPDCWTLQIKFGIAGWAGEFLALIGLIDNQQRYVPQTKLRRARSRGERLKSQVWNISIKRTYICQINDSPQTPNDHIWIFTVRISPFIDIPNIDSRSWKWFHLICYLKRNRSREPIDINLGRQLFIRCQNQWIGSWQWFSSFP